MNLQEGLETARETPDGVFTENHLKGSERGEGKTKRCELVETKR